jgi:hypothetical protein
LACLENYYGTFTFRRIIGTDRVFSLIPVFQKRWPFADIRLVALAKAYPSRMPR